MTEQKTPFPFADQWRFLRRVIADPKHVGAVAPSSPLLSHAMAAQIDVTKPGPILELGPGTGAITREILARGIAPSRLTTVEYDSHFANMVAARFPGVDVIHGDAFDLKRTLGPRADQLYAAALSGIPLLNFSPLQRAQLLDAVLASLAPGAPFILFSYGMQSPIRPRQGVQVRRAAFVWRNMPPARV